jgi:hypothetical protein
VVRSLFSQVREAFPAATDHVVSTSQPPLLHLPARLTTISHCCLISSCLPVCVCVCARACVCVLVVNWDEQDANLWLRLLACYDASTSTLASTNVVLANFDWPSQESCWPASTGPLSSRSTIAKREEEEKAACFWRGVVRHLGSHLPLFLSTDSLAVHSTAALHTHTHSRPFSLHKPQIIKYSGEL